MNYKETERGISVPAKVADSEESSSRTSDESIGSQLRSELGNPQKDPLFNQNFTRAKSMDLKQQELEAIMDSSWIAERVVDVYAEHATKNGATIDVKENDYVDEELANEIESRANDWINSSVVMNTLQQLIEEERYSGIGVLLPVTKERAPEHKRTWDKPMEDVVEIKGWNAISDKYINDIDFNKNPLGSEFRNLDELEINYQEDNATFLQEIHPSRAKALRSRPSRVNQDESLSVFRRMAMTLKTFLNSEWSVGQIVYSMVFKILKTDLGEFDNRKQKQAAERILEKDINALSLAMLDKDDEFKFAGASAGAQGVGPILEFLKDLLSAASQTPKSILFGQQQGEVTGSEKDQQNYYSGIESFQDTHLTPVLKYMLYLKMRSDYGRIIPADGAELKVPPSRVEYEVNWEPIFERSRKEKAEAEQLEAQTERIRTQNTIQKLRTGLITAEEANLELESEDVDPANVATAKSIRQSVTEPDYTEDLDVWEYDEDGFRTEAGPSN